MTMVMLISFELSFAILYSIDIRRVSITQLCLTFPSVTREGFSKYGGTLLKKTSTSMPFPILSIRFIRVWRILTCRWWQWPKIKIYIHIRRHVVNLFHVILIVNVWRERPGYINRFCIELLSILRMYLVGIYTVNP